MYLDKRGFYIEVYIINKMYTSRGLLDEWNYNNGMQIIHKPEK